MTKVDYEVLSPVRRLLRLAGSKVTFGACPRPKGWRWRLLFGRLASFSESMCRLRFEPWSGDSSVVVEGYKWASEIYASCWF